MPNILWVRGMKISRKPISFQDLLEILRESAPLFQTLMEIYERIPEMTCKRRAKCCSLAPELYYVEFLNIMDHLVSIEMDKAIEFIKKIVTSFFLNAMRIIPCPFLKERDCLIYPIRPFT